MNDIAGVSRNNRSSARINIIETHAGFERRYWVDVECSDPYWELEKRRIEVHRDVAHHIFNQNEVIKDLQEQLIKAQEKLNG